MQGTPLPGKMVTCLIAGLISSFAIQRLTYRAIWEFKNKQILPPVFAAIFILVGLLVAIICSVYWHRREMKEQKDLVQIAAFWQGLIRFFIALDLSMIGWQKLFHLQFYTPLGILDLPFSSFSGEALTWAYFGHSYPFICVVGLLQIAGSYLLLFKRTSLFGCFVLLPVLLNIIFIDFFFRLERGELIHALILFAGVLYLLFQDYDRLKAFFFSAKSNLAVFQSKSRFLPVALRLSAVLIPILLILSFGPPDKNPNLTGKYSVKNLLINQKPASVNSCLDSVLTTVYFDQGNDLVFEFNSQQRRLIGSYQFNKQEHRLKAAWRFPSGKPAFEGILIAKGQDQLTIAGKMGADSLVAVLLKNRN